MMSVVSLIVGLNVQLQPKGMGQYSRLFDVGLIQRSFLGGRFNHTRDLHYIGGAVDDLRGKPAPKQRKAKGRCGFHILGVVEFGHDPILSTRRSIAPPARRKVAA